MLKSLPFQFKLDTTKALAGKIEPKTDIMKFYNICFFCSDGGRW